MARYISACAPPGDESRRKSDSCLRAGVEGLVIVDPDERTVEWFARGTLAFAPADGSALPGITSSELAEGIDWP